MQDRCSGGPKPNPAGALSKQVSLSAGSSVELGRSNSTPVSDFPPLALRMRFVGDHVAIRMGQPLKKRHLRQSCVPCVRKSRHADYNQCYACSRCSATSPSDESGALSFGIYPRIPLRELPLGHAVPRLSRRMGGSLLLSAAGEIAIRPTSVRRVTLSSRTQALSIVCRVVLKSTSIEINEFPVYKLPKDFLC